MVALETDASVCFHKHRKRSWIRRIAGKLFYRYGRYFQWYLGRRTFALERSREPLEYVCAEHKTPLVRKLPNAQLWMQQNKITNLRLAVNKLDGIVVNPGETFSFWRIVGKPAAGKGYLPGMVLQSGKIRPGVGGGLCQLTNLIYWMALHTPLTVTERHRHSYDVFPDTDRTQPFGSGATCSYNFLDLQIKNDTNMPYQLKLTVTDDFLEGCWRSQSQCRMRYDVYEKDARILDDRSGGSIRHNAIWRRVYDLDGKLLSDDMVTQNNALMLYPPYLPAGREPAQDSPGKATEGGYSVDA